MHWNWDTLVCFRPPPPFIGLVKTKASVKASNVYIHLVACWCPLNHLKEEEEDLTPLPSKLRQIETLQETLRLERKVVDNWTTNEKRKQHLQTLHITLFARPTSCSCLSLLYHITALPNPSFSTNISLCIHTLIWLMYIIATTNYVIMILFAFYLPLIFSKINYINQININSKW
jgi:hypothetical protein